MKNSALQLDSSLARNSMPKVLLETVWHGNSVPKGSEIQTVWHGTPCQTDLARNSVPNSATVWHGVPCQTISRPLVLVVVRIIVVVVSIVGVMMAEGVAIARAVVLKMSIGAGLAIVVVTTNRKRSACGSDHCSSK